MIEKLSLLVSWASAATWRYVATIIVALDAVMLVPSFPYLWPLAIISAAIGPAVNYRRAAVTGNSPLVALVASTFFELFVLFFAMLAIMAGAKPHLQEWLKDSLGISGVGIVGGAIIFHGILAFRRPDVAR